MRGHVGHPLRSLDRFATSPLQSAMGGAVGAMTPERATKIASITDGTSNTILYGERAQGISTAAAISHG